MNIEIANRLVQLRKENNLSQEALAEKLGISRQAVSKWERAEASPDTDNLIMLARIYAVSLDELLKTDEEITVPSYIEGDSMEDDSSDKSGEEKSRIGNDLDESGNNGAGEYVDVGFNGVHVKDKNGEVHVGWSGIHVDDRKKGDSVHIDKNGIYVNGEKREKHLFTHHAHFPIFSLILIIYLIIGCVWSAWHPGWLLFFLAPIWYSLAEAVEKKNANCFAYPVLVVLIYLCLGFFEFLWHPGWVVFLTIPLYYSIVNYIMGLKERKTEKESENASEGVGGSDEE